MKRVGEFYKVSLEQFLPEITKLLAEQEQKKCSPLQRSLDWFWKPFKPKDDYDTHLTTLGELLYNQLDVPIRATSGSGGYDFKSPLSFTLKAGETIKIPTGMRAKIHNGWWLGCFPRSSLGFQYRLQLDNTVGVVDSDYFYSDNEGHLFVKLTNDSTENKTLSINQGDGLFQALFIPYGITYSDNATAKRNGGLGSTNER